MSSPYDMSQYDDMYPYDLSQIQITPANEISPQSPVVVPDVMENIRQQERDRTCNHVLRKLALMGHRTVPDIFDTALLDKLACLPTESLDQLIDRQMTPRNLLHIKNPKHYFHACAIETLRAINHEKQQATRRATSPVAASSSPPAQAAHVPSAPSFGAAAVPTPGDPSFGAPSFGTPSFGTPSFGAPSFGAPSFGAPSFGAPSFGAPSFGDPSFGAPKRAAVAASWRRTSPVSEEDVSHERVVRSRHRNPLPRH